MGISLIASIIGMILIIRFTMLFLAREWATIMTFFTNVF